LVVFGLWCCLINHCFCLINQCFILYDSEVQKLLSLISVTCQTNEREIPVHKVYDHLWESVAPSMPHCCVVQLWTWLCALHSGMCSFSMVAGSLTLRWLMSYIYGVPIPDVSRSHTMTQHSR
jgi:hypothetical protein